MDHFTRQSNGMYFNLAYEMVPTQSHVSSILQFTTPPTISHPTYKITLGKPSVSSAPQFTIPFHQLFQIQLIGWFIVNLHLAQFPNLPLHQLSQIQLIEQFRINLQLTQSPNLPLHKLSKNQLAEWVLCTIYFSDDRHNFLNYFYNLIQWYGIIINLI